MPASTTPSSGSQEGERLGDYELLQLLGRGGMAEVWLARRRGPARFERKVVIKRILSHHTSDESFVKMFLAEARLCARLNHPNIVAVNELGETDGQYYIVMEYVHGRDLRSMLQSFRGKPIDPGVGAYSVRELCRALGYAHNITDDDGKRLRIIHRDVSPSNVVLSFDGNVKLVDFGIAKALEEAADDHTRTGSLKGKIGYMAPEQLGAAAKYVDHRVDLWAAGVVLWESLTGQRKFRGDNEIHTLDLVRSSVIEAPSVVNAAVPPELDAIALKALNRDPDSRYQSGDEMAAALDAVVSDLRYGANQLSRLMHFSFEDDSHSKSGRLSAALGTARERGDTPLKRTDVPPPDGDELTPQVTPQPSSSPTSLEVPRLRARPMPRWIWAAGAAAVLAIGGGVAIVSTHHEPVPPKPEVKAAVVPPPVEKKTTALTETVDVLIESTPSGADIFVGTDLHPRGKSPVHVRLPWGTVAVPVRAEHAGFAPAKVEVTPAHDEQLSIALTPAVAAPVAVHKHAVVAHATPSPAAAATPKPAAPTPAPHQDPPPPKAKPSLRGNQVLDPFE